MELLLISLLLGVFLFVSSFMFKRVNSIFLMFAGLFFILISSLLFSGSITLTSTTNEVYTYNYSYNPPLLLNVTQVPEPYPSSKTNLLAWFLLLPGIYIFVLSGFDLKNDSNGKRE